MIDFIEDVYASHILRSLLSILVGADLGSGVTASRRGHSSHSLKSKSSDSFALPEQFTELAAFMLQRLLTLPELPS